MIDLSRLAFVDIETTGTAPGHDRIIDIGIIRVENGQISKKFSSFFDPSMRLPPEITRLTGIEDHHLASAPTFLQKLDEIAEILEDCVFVAHNVHFDYGFVKKEFENAGRKFSAKRMCTVRLSRKLYPKLRSHNLDTLIQTFDLKCENRHRGMGDAEACMNFFNHAIDNFSEEEIQKALEYISEKRNIPPHIDPQMIENLPETPGIYKFFSATGGLLYVGKSKNIKARVKSHFQEARFFFEIASLEHEETGTELKALLRELELIKNLKPLHNKVSRETKELFIWKRIENKDGYFELQKTKDFDDAVLISKDKNKIQEFIRTKAKEKNLCLKLLGLEKTNRACFLKQIGVCHGACTNSENPLLYNIRFQEAFPKLIAPWPFKSKVLIDGVVFDNWCIEGQAFDYEIYKILYMHLKKLNNLNSVQSISDNNSDFLFSSEALSYSR